MKKFALYIALAILLLSLGNNIKSAEEVTVLGNVPGNFLNGGYFVEDEKFFYYSDYADSWRKAYIYKVNKESLETTKLATTISRATCLNVADKYVYFTYGSSGSIWKINKNGFLCRPVLFTQATDAIISEDRIYYRFDLLDGPLIDTEWLKPYVGSIYSCDLNGKNKKLISKEEILHFVVDGDKIYYTDHTDNYSIWRMDTSGENKEKLHSRESSEPEFCVPNFDEKYLYFTADNCLYRMDKETLKKDILLEDNFSEMIVYGDSIFFSTSDERGIYRLSKDGNEKEHLFKGKISGFYVAENSLFFYYNKGRHHLDIETRELTKLLD